MQVLFICTANLCRSPMAAALLAGRPEVVDAGVTVASAGLLDGGRPVPVEVVEALRPYGLDVSDHRSRQVTPEALAGADLVVAMGRRHLHEAVLADPTAWPRAFRLKELDHRTAGVGPRRTGEDGPAWVARIHEGRTRRDLTRWSPDEDVADPYGGPAAGYAATAAELDTLIAHLAGRLCPPGAGVAGGH